MLDTSTEMIYIDVSVGHLSGSIPEFHFLITPVADSIDRPLNININDELIECYSPVLEIKPHQILVFSIYTPGYPFVFYNPKQDSEINKIEGIEEGVIWIDYDKVKALGKIGYTSTKNKMGNFIIAL